MVFGLDCCLFLQLKGLLLQDGKPLTFDNAFVLLFLWVHILFVWLAGKNFKTSLDVQEVGHLGDLIHINLSSIRD